MSPETQAPADLNEAQRRKALEPYMVLVGERRDEKREERKHLPPPSSTFCQLLVDAENVILRCKAHEFFGEEESRRVFLLLLRLD